MWGLSGGGDWPGSQPWGIQNLLVISLDWLISLGRSLLIFYLRDIRLAASVLEAKWRKGLEWRKVISPWTCRFPLNSPVASMAPPPSAVLCVHMPSPSASTSWKRKPPTLSGRRKQSGVAMHRRRVSMFNSSYTDFQPALLCFSPIYTLSSKVSGVSNSVCHAKYTSLSSLRSLNTLVSFSLAFPHWKFRFQLFLLC